MCVVSNLYQALQSLMTECANTNGSGECITLADYLEDPYVYILDKYGYLTLTRSLNVVYFARGLWASVVDTMDFCPCATYAHIKNTAMVCYMAGLMIDAVDANDVSIRVYNNVKKMLHMVIESVSDLYLYDTDAVEEQNTCAILRDNMYAIFMKPRVKEYELFDLASVVFMKTYQECVIEILDEVLDDEAVSRKHKLSRMTLYLGAVYKKLHVYLRHRGRVMVV